MNCFRGLNCCFSGFGMVCLGSVCLLVSYGTLSRFVEGFLLFGLCSSFVVGKVVSNYSGS